MSYAKMTRRQLLKHGAGGASLLLGSSLLMRPAFSAQFPSEDVNALIPFSPGGGTDRSVRLLTPAWEQALGTKRRFRPDNQPGAGTLIAHNQLKRAKPDGHSILFTPAPHVAWLSVLEPEQFDIEQIRWIGSYFQDPNVLLVAKDSPFKTAAEFIDAARNSDKPFTASVSSPMSAAHAATVVLREKAGINLKVIPFDGGAESRNAVAGGHVDCCLAPYWSATNVVDLTRALCVFADSDPSQGLWDAPPASEALDFEMPDLQEPYGALVTAQMAEEYPDRYQLLVDTFLEAIESEAYQEPAEKQDLHYFSKPWGPDKTQAFVTEYLELLAQYRESMLKDLETM